MFELPILLDDLVAFSRHLRTNPKSIKRSDLARLEYFHQMLTYHVTYGARLPTPISVERSADLPGERVLVARRCSIEGCWGGPTLWNIRAGSMNGEAVWRCLAHIPPDITFPVGLSGDEWKATGRK